MLAKKKPPAIDLDVVLGGGDKSGKSSLKSLGGGGDEGADEGMGEEGSEEDALPPGFAEAAEEFQDATKSSEERTQSLYRAIKACEGSG